MPAEHTLISPNHLGDITKSYWINYLISVYRKIALLHIHPEYSSSFLRCGNRWIENRSWMTMFHCIIPCQFGISLAYGYFDQCMHVRISSAKRGTAKFRGYSNFLACVVWKLIMEFWSLFRTNLCQERKIEDESFCIIK